MLRYIIISSLLFILIPSHTACEVCPVRTISNIYQEVGKVSFYLTNDSYKSIPLIIPNVMNPNLSPRSSSGVTLRLGQKIYFRKRLKRYLLLEVTKEIKEGEVIEVSALLKKRSRELGL